MPQIKREDKSALEEWVRRHYTRLAMSATSYEDAAEQQRVDCKRKRAVGRSAIRSAADRLESEWRRYRISPVVRWIGRPRLRPAMATDVAAVGRKAVRMLDRLRPMYEPELCQAFQRLVEQELGFVLSNADAEQVVASASKRKGDEACQSNG